MNPILKSLAALVLAVLLGATGAYTADITKEKLQSATLAQLNGATQASSEKFDGRALYKTAFEALRDFHITLADEKARAQWSKEWENKFDKTGQLSTQEGANQAIETMIRSLNQRFDHYETPELKRQTREQMDSSLVGIGVQLTLKDLNTDSLKRSSVENLKVSDKHPLIVGAVVEDGPAQKAGLKEGDIIEAVNGEKLAGMSMAQVLSSIRGTKGSKVTLTIKRNVSNQPKTLSIDVIRDAVVTPVVHYKVLGNGIAYVRLDHFLSKHAVAEMAAALKKASTQRGLILDLRNNPGGDLEIAIEITAMLLPEGSIVELKSRDGNKLVTERVSVLKELMVLEGTGKGQKMQAQVEKRPELIVDRKLPVVVLVNEYSASAAELLSGALQKSGRATVVGSPTVGKGVGQVMIDLPFDRTIGVTNFEFLPAAQSIDWVGIVPDINSPTAQGVPFGDPRDRQLNSAAVQAVSELIDRAEKIARAEEEAKQAHKRSFELDQTQN